MDTHILLKIILAALLGGIIGLEREASHKGAGFRTNTLIAIGSALFTALSIELARGVAGADPGRVAAQIVTGVGFIGAGAIIQARFAVHGLTTAATIWTVSAIGFTIGVGRYFLAFMVTACVMVILILFRGLSHRISTGDRISVYRFLMDENPGLLIDIKKVIHEFGLHSITLDLQKTGKGYELEALLRASDTKHRRFLESVLEMEGVHKVINDTL